MFTEEEKIYLESTNLEQVKEFIANTLKTKLQVGRILPLISLAHFRVALICITLLYNNSVSVMMQILCGRYIYHYQVVLISLPPGNIFLLSPNNQLISPRPEFYRELIQSLFSFNWIGEKKIIISFMNLVCLFVSSNPIFLIPSLQMLIKNLVPQLPQPPTAGALLEQPLTDEYLNELKQRQEYIHRTIHSIFRLAPTAILEIHPILVENFPHKRLNLHVQQEYVTQLLFLSQSFPQLQGRIIELIFSKCLELDVDIVIEDSGDAHIAADADDDDDGNDFFQLDDNPYQHSSRETRRRSGMGEAGAMKIRDDVAETAQKLDCILTIVLSYIQSVHSQDQQIPESDNSQTPSVKLFQQMLEAFELRVMTTYKAKYVQFTLFYSCQLNPFHGMMILFFFSSLMHHLIGELFLQKLSSLFLDPSNHLLSRQSAVVYLASLIARGQFVSFHTARYVSILFCSFHSLFLSNSNYLSLLLQWAGRYVQQRGQESIPKGVSLQRVNSDVLADYSSYLESATLGAYSRQGQLLDEFGRKVITDNDTLIKHETFFCCVQSMCYAICFLGISMAQIMSSETTEKRNWELVLNSEFHPLRYCIPTVRTEFLRIAAAGGLLSSAFGAGRASSNLSSSSSCSHNPLDTFFPFDPCLLLQVHEHIKEGYRVWESEVVLNDHEESSDEDQSDGEGEEHLESVEDSEILSSVASSMASMGFSYTEGMNISLSVGGVGVGSPSTSTLASRVMIKKSDLRRDALVHNTPPSNTSSPYRSLTNYEDLPAEIGTNGAPAMGEDAWLAMLRSKRSRQYSVGSAGSW